MKILLVTKQPLLVQNGKVFCSFAVSSTIRHFERYGELYICSYQFNGKSSQPIDEPTDIPADRIAFLQNESSIKHRYIDRSHNKNVLNQWVQKVDLVIGYNPSTVGDLALRYAHLHGKKYMTFLVSCIWDGTWHHRNWKAKAMALIFTKETKHTVLHSDYVWYVTEQFLQQRYPTNGVALGCTDTNIPDADDSVLHNRLARIDNTPFSPDNTAPAQLSLLTVGHLDVGFKGQIYVIKALALLKAKGIHAHYYMIGAGDNKYLMDTAVSLGVQEQVTFLGRKTRDEVLQWMDRTDLYLQPSLQEGLPRSIAEAMSRAMPVIGSRTGGIPEMLDNAFVTHRKNDCIPDIANIISHLDKATMRQQAIRNFDKAKSYQQRNIVEKLDAFFKQVIL